MRCSNCDLSEEMYSKKVAQFAEEIAFLEERHVLTAARKSDLMRDWLADQARLHQLRCQIRGAGGVPII